MTVGYRQGAVVAGQQAEQAPQNRRRIHRDAGISCQRTGIARTGARSRRVWIRQNDLVAPHLQPECGAGTDHPGPGDNDVCVFHADALSGEIRGTQDGLSGRWL